MTVSIAYVASVNVGLNPPPTGYDDKGSGESWSSAILATWTAQGSGTAGVGQFNNTASDYAEALDFDSQINDIVSYPVLLYNFAANWSPSITSGATINSISGTISRTEGTSTNVNALLYDLCVQLWIFNGSDLSNGSLGSNQANTSTSWPLSASPASNFATHSYTFAATTYANVANSNFGILIGVDGSEGSKAK
jgi:hypothetical protein